ncbi:MAG TPA: acyl-CoA dehydrogenase family protein [Xanthobacteraceae bacterium]
MTLAETLGDSHRTARPNGKAFGAAAALNVVPATPDLKSRAQAVAAVAAAQAAAVDRAARFPGEALAAAKAQRLLGILVPTDLGGEGATITNVVETCYTLARACASTGMIYAMHQIMVACLTRHAQGSAWHRRFLRRLSSDQLLLASSTTDGQGGGDLRKSDCAVDAQGAEFTLVKNATVMSYGAQADAIVATARRTPDAPPTDQVLVAIVKEDYTLEHQVDWDTLGMRGTCSAGFKLAAQGAIEQIFPEPYHRIHTQTVMAMAHLTWSAVWAGIAAGAVDRARAFVRGAARKSGGQMPPGAAHLTRANATLATLRGTIASALQHYESILSDAEAIAGLEFQTRLNLLKVTASEHATAIVMSTLQANGLSGFRNDGEFSIARHLRDVLSSSIMINNDRILANTASAALLVDVAPALMG